MAKHFAPDPAKLQISPLGYGDRNAFPLHYVPNQRVNWHFALEADVDRDSGAIAISHVVCAVDCGEVVAPDSIVNQTEGGILQSLSWTLYEAVHFNDTRILSADWSAYPILRFSAVPDSVEVHVVDNPGSPYLGVAEAAQGPTAGAIANAFRHATGERIHDLPYTRERVKAVLGV